MRILHRPLHPIYLPLALVCWAIACRSPGGAPSIVPGRPFLPAREGLDFDPGWRFHLGDVDDAARIEFDTADWRALDLPHDWSVERPIDRRSPLRGNGGYFLGGVGWYRKTFQLPPDADGRNVTIEFDGVYHHSDVYINGVHLGHRPYGYSSFAYDLTPHLRRGGENVLAVRVDNSDGLNSRWYSGSGIYRHVRLILTDPLRIDQWGVAVTTPRVSRGRADVVIQATVVNRHNDARECALDVELIDPRGRTVAAGAAAQTIPAGEISTFTRRLRIAQPALWSPASPELYTARLTVRDGDRAADTLETPFGIRSIEWNADRGFLLNGGQLKLKGVCMHHDLGPLGAAFNDRAMERRLEILKSIGCNAIRTAHNPPAPQLLDLCDRMGFVVIDEAFDKWEGRFYAARTEIAEWGPRDLEAMILRDRNHPSVVLWSLGNEIQKQGQPFFYDTLAMLAAHARRLDPSRPTTVALKPVSGDTMEQAREIILKTADLVDVVGLNYMEHHVDPVRQLNPKIPMYSAESYCFFYPGGMDTRAYTARNTWWDVANKDHLAGQFIWAGVEYLGESWRWPEIAWGDAPIDLCGFLKPQAYWRKSVWTDEPLVHIAVADPAADIYHSGQVWSWPKLVDHWTLPHYKDSLVRLYTFSNCEEVELFLDGKSKGVRRPADDPNRMLEWWLPYGDGGTVRAVGRNGGVEAAVHEIKTAGAPARIELEVDRTAIAADGVDQAYVTARILDADGNLVPATPVTLYFNVEGPGRLAGVGSGDITDHGSFRADWRQTYHGRALAILQSTTRPGPLELTVHADEIPTPAILTIDVR
jgi:beta-galactosidase